MTDDIRDVLTQAAHEGTETHSPQLKPTPERKSAIAGDDLYVSDPQLGRMFGGVTSMTLWRWRRQNIDPLPFPVKLNGRNYKKRNVARSWWQRSIARDTGRKAG